MRKEEELILKRCVLLVALLLMLVVAANAQTLEPTTMTANGTTSTLLLTPSCVSNGTSYDYTYTLKNMTSDDYIVGFGLLLPVSGVTNIIKPEGWKVLEFGTYLQWQLMSPPAFNIAPNAEAVFGFTSAYACSTTKNVFATSQDTYGFNGQTYGPAVPEPGSILALATGLVGLVGMLKKK